MWICFCDAIFVFFCGSTPQVLYSRMVCHLHCHSIFAGQRWIPIEQVAFMYKTHCACIIGVGWARVTKPQPIPIPVCTRGIYLQGFTNPWYSHAWARAWQYNTFARNTWITPWDLITDYDCQKVHLSLSALLSSSLLNALVVLAMAIIPLEDNGGCTWMAVSAELSRRGANRALKLSRNLGLSHCFSRWYCHGLM